LIVGSVIAETVAVVVAVELHPFRVTVRVYTPDMLVVAGVNVGSSRREE
jgi:hypothetical protein